MSESKNGNGSNGLKGIWGQVANATAVTSSIVFSFLLLMYFKASNDAAADRFMKMHEAQQALTERIQLGMFQMIKENTGAIDRLTTVIGELRGEMRAKK